MEKFQYMRSKQKNNEGEQLEIKSVINFCNQNSHLEDDTDLITQYEELSHLKNNEVYMNLVDAALTLPTNHEQSIQLINEARKCKKSTNISSEYEKFCENLFKIFDEVEEKTENISRILTNSSYSLKYDKFKAKNKFFCDMLNILKQFCTTETRKEAYISLLELISNQNYSSENYLRKIYNYLSLLAQLLSYDEDIFEILNKNRAAMIGDLFFVQNIPPRELESLFSKLELDIIYHIAWYCLPIIKLHVNQKEDSNFIESGNSTFAEYFKLMQTKYSGNEIDVKMYTPDFSLLSYIRRRNWLLAYIINKIHEIEEAKPDTNSNRTKFFNNLLNLPRNQMLKKLYDENLIITSLQHKIDVGKFINFLHEQERKDWKILYQIIDNFPENISVSNKDLCTLRDYLICNLVSGLTVESEEYLYVQRITNCSLRIQCILDNLKNWQGKVCIDVLENELTHKDSFLEREEELQEWLKSIKLYENVRFMRI